jgi:hypothetical protein
MLSVDPRREQTGPAPAARLTTLLAGLANGLWAVAAGLGVVASGVLLAWLGSGAQAPFVDVLRVIGLGWGFGTGATLQSGDVAWSLTPLGLTLLIIALAYRGGLWAADTARPLTAPALGVLVAGSAVSSAALGWAIAAGSGLGGTTLDPLQAAGRTGLLCGVGALISAAVAAPELRARVAGAVPAWLRVAPSSTALACAVLVMGVAGALTLTMVSSFGAVTSLLEQLAPDPGGLFALLLVCLAYVPTALVWTLAVLAGPGMGIGSVVVTSSSVATGPLPGFPLLGLVPETMPVWVAPAGIVLLLAAGVLAGHHATRQTRKADEHAPVWAPVATAAVAGAGVTVAVALACLAASGSMGPGSLAQVGPPTGAVTAVCGLAVTTSATATAAVIGWRRRSRPEA